MINRPCLQALNQVSIGGITKIEIMGSARAAVARVGAVIEPGGTEEAICSHRADHYGAIVRNQKCRARSCYRRYKSCKRLVCAEIRAAEIRDRQPVMIQCLRQQVCHSCEKGDVPRSAAN